MPKCKDLAGIRFGTWTATNDIEYINKRACRVCWCDCGNKGIILTSNLLGDKSKGCTECCISRSKKNEGDSSLESPYHGIYISHKNMMARCYSRKDKSYEYYGANGVTVASYFQDYSKFKEWALQNGWSKGLVISRNKDIGNYTIDNVAWITRSENSTESGLRPKLSSRKLFPEDIRYIRSLSITRGTKGIKLQDISNRYGVSVAQLKAIRLNKSYKDVT